MKLKILFDISVEFNDLGHHLKFIPYASKSFENQQNFPVIDLSRMDWDSSSSSNTTKKQYKEQKKERRTRNLQGAFKHLTSLIFIIILTWAQAQWNEMCVLCPSRTWNRRSVKEELTGNYCWSHTTCSRNVFLGHKPP